ncbi:unnamed protein product [Musa hybrid cultivar]
MMQGGVFVTGFPTEDGMGFIKILKHLLVDINMVLFMSGYMRNILYRIVLQLGAKVFFFFLIFLRSLH